MIGQLGHHVLRHALADLAEWRASGLVDDSVRMCVNVSGRQLDDPQFPDQVLEALAAAAVPGKALHLEITEGTLMREPERMARIATEVCASGVGLELDDFGTGYSSLAAIHRFPVSGLKIDRSFVSALGVDGDAIVRSTVALAHALGMKVTAEGIETPYQLGELRALGCEYGQGYLFSPAVPADKVEELVAELRRTAEAASPSSR